MQLKKKTYSSWSLLDSHANIASTPFSCLKRDKGTWVSAGFSKEVDKVENILKGSLDSIQSPSPSVKIQIMAGKFA